MDELNFKASYCDYDLDVAITAPSGTDGNFFHLMMSKPDKEGMFFSATIVKYITGWTVIFVEDELYVSEGQEGRNDKYLREDSYAILDRLIDAGLIDLEDVIY